MQRQRLKASLAIVGLLGVAIWSVRFAHAQEPEWPVEIDATIGRVMVYQPQPESFENDRLTARAAVSIERSGEREPIFGAIWLEARVLTDRDARTVTVREIAVPTVKLAEAAPAEARELSTIIQTELAEREHTFSLDRLLTTLDDAVDVRDGGHGIRHAPPRIVVAREPTVLVTIDGPPKLQAVHGSPVMRVVNTPFIVLLDAAAKTYYVRAGSRWVGAQSLAGPWHEARPPSHVLSALPKSAATVESDAARSTKDVSARVLIATEPTELLVCDGEPQWTPLVANELLYLSNSDSDAFMELGTRRVFVLLSGRWYVAKSLDEGPWKHVPADELPEAFSRIPPDSAKASVLTFVGGTDEAREGILDASMPQTSVIRRSEARCAVTYDGEPKFEAIEGTKLRYAVNTSSSVLELDGKFYCCSEGVWFVADDATGPWTVCAHVPEDMYQIPPSCPIYPVRYVYVYDSTPDVVYVGYLPGYVGCHVAGPTIVYGTGYWYPGWYGSVYYAKPCTWGFAAHYDPWLCDWTLGLGFGWGVHPGWFACSVGWCHTGWWGPGGFCGHHFDIHGSVVHVHDDTAVKPAPVGHRNVYRRSHNASRNSATSSSRREAGVRQPSVAQYDLYVDREGRVLRRDTDGWQERRPSGWMPARPLEPSPSEPRARPTPLPPPRVPPPVTPPRPSIPPVRPVRPPTPPRHEFDRMQQARERGNARASALRQRAPPRPPPARPPR